MKISDFYAVAPLHGVNKTAGKITARGEHWTPSLTRHVSETPLPLEPIKAHFLSQPSFRDLTGERFGKLTVIGYGGGGRKDMGARWVCRCACGRYEYRYKKKLLRLTARNLQCAECEKLHEIKREYTIRKSA